MTETIEATETTYEGNSFFLIVVLFILLIIVGASYVY